MTCIDFRSTVDFDPSLSAKWKGVADVYGTGCFLAVDGLLAEAGFRQVCPAGRWQLPDAEVLLPRPVFLHGFRTAYLSRKPSRYRDVPARRAAQSLPCRHPGEGFPKYPGQGQREKRLAHLCRFRSGTDPHRQEIVCQGGLRCSPEADGLRLRFHHDRPLPYRCSPGHDFENAKPPSSCTR